MTATIHHLPTRPNQAREKASDVLATLETKIAYLTPEQQVNARLIVAADIIINSIINGELGEDPKIFLDQYINLAIGKADNVINGLRQPNT